jgi:putative salt-induced outer membrane protein YdiY
MPFTLELAVALVTLVAPFAKPDEVVFKNGEKLVGKVKQVLDGKVIVESDSLGTIKAPLDKVATIATDEPVELVLADGNIVKRKLVASEDGTVILQEEGVPGEQRIAISQIKKVNPEPVKWTGALAIGATWSRGNSDTDQGTVTFNAVRRGEDDRVTLGAFYASTRTKDPLTNDWSTSQFRFGAKAQYDYFLSKTDYAFLTLRGEKDRIAGFDFRGIGGVGLGQQWVEGADLSVATEEAVTWTVENYNTGQSTESYGGVMLAYHVTGNIREGLYGFHNLIYNQGLEDGDDSFFEGDIGLRASLTSAMFAEFKVLFRYDNTPPVGKERGDVLYILGVGWSF